MDLAACHINADFDCLASLILAGKLYPGARLVFPGSQERNVRDYLAQLGRDLGFARLRDLDLASVRRLILVDTRQASRIGELKEVALRPGVSVEVFDHHPPDPTDLPARRAVVGSVGATTTLLVERVRRRGIHLTPLEATIAALGIYEDTGSLTFVSTTPDDLRAVAWLLTRGADLRTVAEFVDRDLTAEQVALLGELISSQERIEIRGVTISLATAGRDRYIGDLAVLAHKLVDMEGLEALVALVRMGERVILVARSRCDEFDARELAVRFGGGGHPTAAAATLRGMTMVEARRRLLAVLRETVRPRLQARQIMTAPVHSVAGEASVADALALMNRVSISTLPVLEGGRLAGLVTRHTLERARGHGLEEQPVERLATRITETVEETADFQTVERLMLARDLRFLPVVRGREIAGVITRADLLAVMLARSRWGPESEFTGGVEFHRNLRMVIEERLPRPTKELLRRIGRAAGEIGLPAFLVGGMVRDLLLGASNEDIDVVVEGAGIRLAGRLVAELGGRMTPHRKFGTATVITADGRRIDVATARTEYYSAPGSLPAVEEGSLRQDLYRRDFTINALALRLNPEGYGQLVDFFGGEKDLRERRVRVLHGLSFIEDPTRAFRAVRFEQRFGFKIDEQTLHFLGTAVATEVFARVSGRRLLQELELSLLELDPYRIFARLAGLGLLATLHPGLRPGPRMRRLFRDVGEALAWHKLQLTEEPIDRVRVLFLALVWELRRPDLAALAERLALTDRRRRRLADDLGRVRGLFSQMARSRVRPSGALLRAMQACPPEALLLALGASRSAAQKRLITDFLVRLRRVRPELTGHDVVAAGVPPGPAVGEALRALAEQVLLGRVEGRDAELDHVRRWVARARRRAAPE